MMQTLSNFVSTTVSTLSTHHWQNVNSKAATGSAKAKSVDIEELPQYRLNEVSQHWSPDDCWIVVFDRVYDVTRFIDSHPGGSYIMLEHAGRDATLVFRGSRHGPDAYDMLDQYLIGVLVEEERLYLGPDMWLER